MPDRRGFLVSVIVVPILALFGAPSTSWQEDVSVGDIWFDFSGSGFWRWDGVEWMLVDA